MNAGFVECVWKNVTSYSLEEYRLLAEKTGNSVEPPIMGVHLILGDQAGLMRKNVVRNLSQGFISVYQGVFKK